MAAQLVLRSKTWSIKYNVPAAQARVIGRRQVWKSTGTGDKATAEKLLYQLTAEIVKQIEREYAAALQRKVAAVPDPKDDLEYVSDLLAQIAARHLDHDTAAELLSARTSPASRR